MDSQIIWNDQDSEDQTEGFQQKTLQSISLIMKNTK